MEQQCHSATLHGGTWCSCFAQIKGTCELCFQELPSTDAKSRGLLQELFLTLDKVAKVEELCIEWGFEAVSSGAVSGSGLAGGTAKPRAQSVLEHVGCASLQDSVSRSC